MGFRLVPKSVTLNDLERRNGRLVCVISRQMLANVLDHIKCHCHISATDGDILDNSYAPVCLRLCAIRRWYDLGFSRSRS